MAVVIAWESNLSLAKQNKRSRAYVGLEYAISEYKVHLKPQQVDHVGNPLHERDLYEREQEKYSVENVDGLVVISTSNPIPSNALTKQAAH